MTKRYAGSNALPGYKVIEFGGDDSKYAISQEQLARGNVTKIFRLVDDKKRGLIGLRVRRAKIREKVNSGEFSDLGKVRIYVREREQIAQLYGTSPNSYWATRDCVRVQLCGETYWVPESELRRVEKHSKRIRRLTHFRTAYRQEEGRFIAVNSEDEITRISLEHLIRSIKIPRNGRVVMKEIPSDDGPRDQD